METATNPFVTRKKDETQIRYEHTTYSLTTSTLENVNIFISRYTNKNNKTLHCTTGSITLTYMIYAYSTYYEKSSKYWSQLYSEDVIASLPPYSTPMIQSETPMVPGTSFTHPHPSLHQTLYPGFIAGMSFEHGTLSTQQQR